MSGIKDLRDFLAVLKDNKLLFETERAVDWKYEIGSLLATLEAEGQRTGLFHNIKDKEFSVCGNVLASMDGIALAPVSYTHLDVYKRQIYKLSSYPDWAAIDYVLSTIRINNSLPKPCLTVNPILQSEDRAAMDLSLIHIYLRRTRFMPGTKSWM